MNRKETLDMAEERVYPPMRPGRVLELEFLEPLDMTSYKLAKAIGVDPPRVYGIVRGKRSITADTALRLARYFGTSAEFWLNLQAHYDLEVEEDRSGKSIEREVQPLVR
jgi:addiction module HigA family antidote